MQAVIQVLQFVQNHHPEDRLDHFSFYYVRENTQPPGTPKPWPTERIFLSRHDSFDEPNAPPNRPPKDW